MLNYGNEKKGKYVGLFIEQYKSMFGDSFVPWTDTVPFPDYVRIVSEAPFYICTSDTQTGLGIIGLSLTQGKAVFISGDNYDWVKNDMGVDVQHTNLFKDFNYSTLCCHVPSRHDYAKRMKKLIVFYEKEHSLQGWRNQIQNIFR